MSAEDELTLGEVLEEAGLIVKWEARGVAQGVTQEKEQTLPYNYCLAQIHKLWRHFLRFVYSRFWRPYLLAAINQ